MPRVLEVDADAARVVDSAAGAPVPRRRLGEPASPLLRTLRWVA